MTDLFSKWNHPDNDRYRGAPLGQEPFGQAPPTGIHLGVVKLDRGGYDKAGTYWGLAQPLYRAWAAGYCRHVRADSRAQAAEKLGLASSQLLRP